MYDGKLFVVGDTHGREVSFESVPEDTLIHLGDWEMGNIKTKARKILIRGNHTDLDPMATFDFICDGLLYNQVWFTHEPAERLPKGAVMNIYGHIHDGKINDYGYEQKSWHLWLPPNEVHLLDKLIFEHREAKREYLRRESI